MESGTRLHSQLAFYNTGQFIECRYGGISLPTERHCDPRGREVNSIWDFACGWFRNYSSSILLGPQTLCPQLPRCALKRTVLNRRELRQDAPQSRITICI